VTGVPRVVRFGIIGPGKVAELHATALSRIDGAVLAGVAGRSPDRVQSLAAAHAATAFTSPQTMVRDEGIDAVIICTPHPLHREQAVMAAQAGVHVVVEKPMALTPADCDEIIAAAESSGVLLSVISQRRWYQPALRMKAAIDDGRIGDPILATVEVLGWRGPEYYAMDAWRGTLAGEGGGVLVNQAVHQLDLVSWLMGPIGSVQGHVANLNHPEIEVEDTAVAVVRFASGALGSIVASNSQKPGLHANVHVHGRNGASVGVETDRGSVFVAGVSPPTLARTDLWTIPGEEGFPERWQREDEAFAATVDLGTYYHELQLRDIVEAIQDGRRPAVDGHDGRAAVVLMDAIYRSSADAATAG
jgi:UDP-N-acetyl-2-amino-2-deoxyglucuronate dehydrogenase